MASASSNAENILLFGNYCKIAHAVDVGTGVLNSSKDPGLLYPDEISFISERLLQNGFDVTAACKEKMSLSANYFRAVRYQLNSLLCVWDAVVDQKNYYDAEGFEDRDEDFLKSLLLCTQIIPQRALIGFLGPFRNLHDDVTGNDLDQEYVQSPGVPRNDCPLSSEYIPPPSFTPFGHDTGNNNAEEEQSDEYLKVVSDVNDSDEWVEELALTPEDSQDATDGMPSKYDDISRSAEVSAPEIWMESEDSSGDEIDAEDEWNPLRFENQAPPEDGWENLRSWRAVNTGCFVDRGTLQESRAEERIRESMDAYHSAETAFYRTDSRKRGFTGVQDKETSKKQRLY